MLSVIWNGIWDWVPWWAWYVIGAIALFATLPYWYPIWAILPRWLKTILIALGAFFAAYLMGRNRGRRNAEQERQQNDANAIQNRQKVDQEISNLPPAAVDKRLDRWVRDD